jgi:hypothetical protein
VADQSGTAAERVVYVFPTGSPRTNLIALVDLAIERGAPIQQGSIASCFNVPRHSLRNISIAEAISETMRWVADGMVYFDYSVDGHPALCMQRRTPAATVTLTPANTVTPRIRIRPRLDLKLEEVTVYYAGRETLDGKRVTTWHTQEAGAATSGLPARQPVVVSGPEKVWDVLPQDFTDDVTVRSAPLDTVAMIVRYDERLRATGVTAADLSTGSYTEAITGGGTFTLPVINEQLTDRDGNAIPVGFNRYLTLGEPRDWWTKDGIEHIQARLAATVWERVNSPVPIPSGYEPAVPAWFEVLGGRHYFYTRTISGGGFQRVDVWATTASVSVPLVKTNWPVPTQLIRAEDYAFVNPPEGLADNLLATQNWLPYEGQVEWVEEDAPAAHHVGAALNIAGFLPETANMRAMICGHGVKLATGQSFLTLGAPDRLAWRDLVSRFRQTGADNIVWLVESVSGEAGENPPPDPELEVPVWPTGALLFNDDPLVFSGEYITYTAA